MKTVALVVASQPHNYNTGMLTVELAGIQYFSERYRLKLVTFPGREDRESNWVFSEFGNRFDHFVLPHDLGKVCECDHIVFWGDFLHSNTFLSFSGVSQLERFTSGKSEAIDILQRCLFLRDEGEAVLKKCILFGGSLLSDISAASGGKEYHDLLLRLVRGASYVFMRDPVSACRVATLRGGAGDSHLGVDPAFLLEDIHEYRVPTKVIAQGRTIGLFVGSRTMVGEGFSSAIKELSRKCGCEVAWIPWLKSIGLGSSHRTPFLQSVLSRVAQGLPGEVGRRRRAMHAASASQRIVLDLANRYGGHKYRNSSSILNAVRNCSVVVTDTYHLAINALRLGVPTIIVGWSQPNRLNRAGTLTDLKKLILFEMLEARDFYFLPDQFGVETADEIFDLVHSERRAAVCEVFNSHRERAFEILDKSLTDRCGH